MDYLLLSASIIGFGPALFLIWLSMRRYTYPHVEGSLFEDRKVFFMLAVGMVAGSLIFVLEGNLFSLFLFEGGIDLVLFVLIYVLAFPLVEDMAKFIILNFKGYRGRFDTVFYGIALGAGQSATAIVGYIMLDLLRGAAGGAAVSGIDWLGLLLLSSSTAMMHVSVGAILGNATARGLGLRGIPLAVVPHMIFNMLMFPWFLTDQIWYSLLFALPVAAFIFWGVHTQTVPETLPEEVKRELRRSFRKKFNK